jgi:hypothetical protein
MLFASLEDEASAADELADGAGSAATDLKRLAGLLSAAGAADGLGRLDSGVFDLRGRKNDAIAGLPGMVGGTAAGAATAEDDPGLPAATAWLGPSSSSLSTTAIDQFHFR